MAGEPGIEWLFCEITIFVHLQNHKGKFFVNEICLFLFFFLFKYLRHPNWRNKLKRVELE